MDSNFICDNTFYNDTVDEDENEDEENDEHVNDSFNLSNSNTCSSPINETQLSNNENNGQHKYKADLKYQEHTHKTNCKLLDEYGEKMCKYHFPKPILNETIILEPLNEEETSREKREEAYEKWTEVQKKVIIRRKEL